ncbi:MAG: hypothetical protein QG635_2146, partial [Bacteroidota bacterium]|nr:hypothetical protein [Bacteroidota bacterium]
MTKKQIKKPLAAAAKKEEKESKPLIHEKYQDLAFIGILVLSIFIFFAGAIFGGGFNVSDNIASVSFRPYMTAANKSGEFPLWIPYIFCGMPSYAALLTHGERLWDIIPEVVTWITEIFGKILGSDSARVSSFYMFFSIGMYFLMRSKNHKRYVAFFTAFAATFSTCVIVWIMIGHNTKIMVFAMFPYIFMLLERLRERFSLLYAVLLVMAVHFMFWSGHLQMIFYGVCAFGIYLIFELVSRFINKSQPLTILRSGAMLAAAGAMAFIMSADLYLSTLEYTQYSTRGSAPIMKTKNQTQDKSGGNDYSYSTEWSFSPEEIMTFFVPNYFGFGRLKYSGSLTNGQEVRVPTYWGQKRFEDVASYMGIFVLGLAFLGGWLYRKDVFIQSLIAICLFALLLSFGNNMSLLYDVFFYPVPSFNTFRAPSMALALMHFSVPILAGYGLSGIIGWRKEFPEKQRKLLIGGMIASVSFLIIGFLYSAAFKSTYIAAVAGSKKVPEYPEIHEFVFKEMMSDWYLTAVIAILAALFVYLFVFRKIKPYIFYSAISLLLVFDLWRVDYRPMEYSKTDIEKEHFQKYDWIDFVKSDNGVFRIADFASESPNMSAYFSLENCNGYHAAKLRVFQDLLDVADNGSTSSVTNPFLWNLMNVKYIITNQEMKGFMPVFASQQIKAFVYKNVEELPRAFFVNNAVIAKQMDILNHLKTGDFNPRDTAFIEEKLAEPIEPYSQGAEVRVTAKGNHFIDFNATATGNNLIFVSEMYYPAGWKAYIDGKETKI